MTSGCEVFTLSPVSYVTIGIKKVVSGLFHAGSTFIESIKRQTRQLELPRNKTIASELFHMQYIRLL